MAMSKKDYQAIALAINHVRAEVLDVADFNHQAKLDGINLVIRAFCVVAATDNPRFERGRFIEACETGACKGMPKRPGMTIEG